MRGKLFRSNIFIYFDVIFAYRKIVTMNNTFHSCNLFIKLLTFIWYINIYSSSLIKVFSNLLFKYVSMFLDAAVSSSMMECFVSSFIACGGGLIYLWYALRMKLWFHKYIWNVFPWDVLQEIRDMWQKPLITLSDAVWTMAPVASIFTGLC